jgi:glutaminyl-tRNA synthetase
MSDNTSPGSPKPDSTQPENNKQDGNDKQDGNESSPGKVERLNFIEQEIDKDLLLPKLAGKPFISRFPPEPNGYLHVGHAKSICLNFGLAQKYGGRCNLRFDDTNPSKEDQEYVDSIMEDVRWLGFQWDELHYASDYFEQLYQWAVQLIEAGKAYVCDLTGDQIREYRGTLTQPGKNSPFRDRSVDENLRLFEGMRAGEFPNGSRTLRAKIDMSSPNLNLRDPVMYRILHSHHHRTGDQWCVYPMYDWAHGQSDSIEEITHSICTLEFQDHRPLYDWFCRELGIYHPRQIEFARLNLSYTVMSKRKLLQLVQEKYVSGWDDPRMPTISGLRRRGYTPESIRRFCDRIGVARFYSTIDVAVLENSVREHLNAVTNRVMVVMRPVKVVITNYPEDHVDYLDAVNNPEDSSQGSRKLPFSRELLIEQEDFMENAPRKFFRLTLGGEVRLRYGYIIRCEEVVKDERGQIVELRCTYDPETRSGSPTEQTRKVKGTIHWVSQKHGVPLEIRLYDRLFRTENPDEAAEGKTFLDNLNPDSLEIVSGIAEPCLLSALPGQRFQFERIGYFCVDPDTRSDRPVFNRIVALRDSWAKEMSKG